RASRTPLRGTPVEGTSIMLPSNLQGVADAVARRAQRQGYVVPREIREELATAGVPEAQWRDVLGLTRPALTYRNGRYYYPSPVSARPGRESHTPRAPHRPPRQLIRRHKAIPRSCDRRGQERIGFVQPVQVRTEDGRELTLLSRDISPDGIRLIGA